MSFLPYPRVFCQETEQNVKPDSTTNVSFAKMSQKSYPDIGLFLEGGFAETGYDLEKEQSDFQIGLFDKVYFRIGGVLTGRYWMDSSKGISFGISNTISNLTNRSPNFSEGEYLPSDPTWKISINTISIGLIGRSSFRNNGAIIGGVNLEYYASNSQISSNLSPTVPIHADQKGNGFGFSEYVGREFLLSHGVSSQFSVLFRLGKIHENSHDITPNDLNWKSVSFNTTGLYLNVGFIKKL